MQRTEINATRTNNNMKNAHRPDGEHKVIDVGVREKPNCKKLNTIKGNRFTVF